MWRRQPCASIEAKECMTRTADRARGDPPRITRVGKTWRAHESLFVLPRGRRDFFVQLAIWLGFAFGYQVARGLADRGTGEALTHARWIFHLEQRLDAFFEPDLQRRVLQAGGLLLHAVNWTYWLSQLAVVGLALLWIYLRHNAAYPRVRDALIVTNTIGLLIYLVLPTAPPRLLPGIGIQDTISQAEVVSRSRRPRQARGKSLCRDAEPARRRCTDHWTRARGGRSSGSCSRRRSSSGRSGCRSR